MTERFAARTTTRSAAATRALGVRLGRLLTPGDVVALVGDLGAGKTQLVRGACAGAGVPEAEVSSPSFAIVATYRGRIPVHHADLYRIADEEELYGTGFGDLPGGEGALLVEWADRIPGALPEERLTIQLGHAKKPNERHVAIEGVGDRHCALARAMGSRPFDSAPASRALRSGRTGSVLAVPVAGSRAGSRSRSRSGSGSRSRPRPRPRRA